MLKNEEIKFDDLQDARKQQKIIRKLEGNFEFAMTLYQDFQARVVITPNSVRFAAPTKHFDSVKDTIAAVVQSI
jgi:hypothetical protein